MSTQSTYAFKSIDFVMTHPAAGQFSMNGEGMGDVTVTMTNDVSAHHLAADGSVMTSRIAADNGTVTINAQQTSALHKYMERLYNYLLTAENDQWTAATILINDRLNREKITCTGVCFQKRPDTNFQQQGQTRAWVMMAADIQKEVL